MNPKSTLALRNKRATLLKRLPDLQHIIRGSVIERYKPCGKPNCKCAKGQGHGPKFYLSISQPGSNPRMDYVPIGYIEQVEEYLENFQRAMEILDEICQINQELLRRREDL